jgi:uncharacterized protein YndB with AHSA1/START domain
MARLTESTTINASRETIWHLLTTPGYIVQWFVGLDAVNATADYPAVGSRIEGGIKVLGIELESRQTVTTMTPGEAIEYRLEGVVSGTQNWRVEEVGGGYQVTVDMEYSLTGGVLGRVAEPAVHQINVQNGRQSLVNLKGMAEAL